MVSVSYLEDFLTAHTVTGLLSDTLLTCHRAKAGERVEGEGGEEEGEEEESDEEEVVFGEALVRSNCSHLFNTS